jgi:hypothetical protein
VIELQPEAATMVVGVAAILVSAWGAALSIRSAARGPRWALGHISSIRPVIVGGLGFGLVLLVAVRPAWAGLAVMYVAATALLLSVMLRRGLTRLDALGGLDDLPIERRRAIVQRARRLILGAGLVLGVLGVGGSVAGVGPVAWIPAALGVTLVVTAIALGADDRPV